MTYEDQVSFYNGIEFIRPVQKHFRVGNVITVLNMVGKPFRVLEFGGWKGDLASEMITHYGDSIISWTNIEICEAAINKTFCHSEKYKVIKPLRFDWFSEERIENPDVIIATHFIEHISNEHFELLARYISGVPIVYFEAPMGDDTQSWCGYGGTHKLIYGWNDVKRIMGQHGYKNIGLRRGRGNIFIWNENELKH